MIAVVLAVPCYAEDSEDQRVETLHGTVTSIDWVGSYMTVDSTRFLVPPGIEVSKGNDQTEFSGINVGDQAIVTYKRESSGALQAISITIEYRGDFPA